MVLGSIVNASAIAYKLDSHPRHCMSLGALSRLIFVRKWRGNKHDVDTFDVSVLLILCIVYDREKTM